MGCRRIAWGASAALVLMLGTQPAGAGVCEESATFCVPDSGIVAACRSIGILSVGDGTAVSHAASSITSSPASQSHRQDVASVRRQTPLGIVEANGVHATCVSYTAGPSGRRGCGRADIGDIMIDMNAVAGVVITARGLVEDGCTSAGAGAGGTFHESRIGQVVLHVGGGSGPIDVKTDPNTGVPLGGGYALWVNESSPVSGVCPRTAGSALRVQGPAGSLVIGWVATAACL